MKKIFCYILLFALLLNLPCKPSKPKNDWIKGLAALYLLKTAIQDASGTSDYDNIKTWYSTMETLEVQVVYESGATPYYATFTNPKTGNSQYVWDIFNDNLQEMFKNRSQSITTSVPKELSSMTEISSQSKSTWTTSDITNLGKTYRTEKSTSTKGVFLVAFVNGYYSSDGSTQDTSVIGVSVSGTPYIAIFKDVITSISYSNPIEEATVGEATRIYVEQATLVHEMGHALGLVNNGVTMVTSHQDTSNGKHCSNTACVMYYANSGTSALVSYIKSFLDSGSTVMFKTYCLEDTQSYQP